MRIDYEELKKEVQESLDHNKIWVLSTEAEHKVTSRSMSVVHRGLQIYFQTNECYVKSEQMSKNSNVALCTGNISIEGTAKEIGSWRDEKNKELMELYASVHPGSFEAYGMLEGQVLYEVTPRLVKLWKYIGGTPIRQNLSVEEETAEQLDFM